MSSLKSPRTSIDEEQPSLSPRKKLTKFRNTKLSSATKTKDHPSKRMGAIGGMLRKKSSQGIIVATQLDLTQNPIKAQREFQLHEISEIKCFEGEVLKSVKKSIQQTAKAVTYFNTKYYKGKTKRFKEKNKKITKKN